MIIAPNKHAKGLTEAETTDILTVLASQYQHKDSGIKLREAFINITPPKDILPMLVQLGHTIGTYREEKDKLAQAWDKELDDFRDIEQGRSERLERIRVHGSNPTRMADAESDLEEARRETCDTEAEALDAKMQLMTAEHEALLFENALSSLPEPYKEVGDIALEEFYREFPFEIKAGPTQP